MSIFKRNNKMLCNDVYTETSNIRMFRELDSDPAYKEEKRTYICDRNRGHEGDHKGWRVPAGPQFSSNEYAIWPPKGYIDERDYV